MDAVGHEDVFRRHVTRVLYQDRIELILVGVLPPPLLRELASQRVHIITDANERVVVTQSGLTNILYVGDFVIDLNAPQHKPGLLFASSRRATQTQPRNSLARMRRPQNERQLRHDGIRR